MGRILLRFVINSFVLFAAYILFGKSERAFFYGVYAELLCLILGGLL